MGDPLRNTAADAFTVADILLIRTYALYERSRQVLGSIVIIGLGSLAIVGVCVFYKLINLRIGRLISLSSQWSILAGVLNPVHDTVEYVLPVGCPSALSHTECDLPSPHNHSPVVTEPELAGL